MMDWTDRHCRVFHRLLAPRALLFTEMVTTGAVLFGDRERLLGRAPGEGRVVLQLGGSEPEDLAQAIRAAEAYGYDGYNLNCGCPSDRVRKGAFGACLMAEPERVRDLLAAMRDATAKEVSVKCRIGIDDADADTCLERFVATCAASGVETFIVHARQAWLRGLSPKQNREIPPLRYDVVARLKQRHPRLTVILNGGIETAADVAAARRWADGVMVGRAAYQNPRALPELEAAALGGAPASADEARILDALAVHLARLEREGVPPAALLRHVLGLFNGRPGARRWRRLLSERMHGPEAGPELLHAAAPLLAPA